MGLSFWKSPCRKLYAVTFSDIQQSSQSHSRSSRSFHDQLQDVPDSSDDDIDRDDLNPKKKRKYDRPLQRLTDEVTAIRDIITDMMSLTSDTNIPLGLRRVLRDTFKCQICHNVSVRPPVIVTKCCRNILGCQDCVNTWYSGPEAMTRTCPMCRAEHGCNETMMLRGLTNFMETIKKIYEG